MKKISVFVFLIVGFIAACSFEAAVPKYVGSAGSPPELLAVRTSSSSEVQFLFSEPVNVVSLMFDPPVDSADSAEGDTVSVQFGTPYAAGTKVSVDILVQNADGNTLEAVLTFNAFNDHVPTFLINELRTEMTKPRIEFIELRMLSAGNLAGVRLFVASSGTAMPVYDMPSVEVVEGEYVLVHLRVPDYINAVDELEGNLALSTADDAKAQIDCPLDVRDLWIPDNKKIVHKSDAVYFMDQTDNIIDAIVFCDKAKDVDKWGSNPNFLSAMDTLTASEAWTGSDIDGAFDSSGTTTTNTIVRNKDDSDTNTAQDWYKSGSGKASPGKENP
jgi:hypothetical protein